MKKKYIIVTFIYLFIIIINDIISYLKFILEKFYLSFYFFINF